MHTLSFTDLMLIGLTVNQIIEVWRHSLMFHWLRLYLQTFMHEAADKPRWYTDIFIWPAHLLLCNWCFSIWVALGVGALFVLVDHWWVTLFMLMFAGSRVANLLNDCLHYCIRTPKYDSDEQPGELPRDINMKEELAKMQAEFTKWDKEEADGVVDEDEEEEDEDESTQDAEDALAYLDKDWDELEEERHRQIAEDNGGPISIFNQEAHPETNRPKRETKVPRRVTPPPIHETKAGAPETSVSANENDQTQTQPPPPPPSER